MRPWLQKLARRLRLPGRGDEPSRDGPDRPAPDEATSTAADPAPKPSWTPPSSTGAVSGSDVPRTQAAVPAAANGSGSDGGTGRTKLAAAALGLILLGGLIAWGAFELTDEDAGSPAPAPIVVIEDGPEPEAAEEIGFPAFATLNTTRVGGADPIANAAAVALAAYPSVGGVAGPKAVVLAEAGNWQAAIAAASLTADPIGAPILLGEPEGVPEFTAQALAALAPSGIQKAEGVQLLAVGDVALPEGLKALPISGESPFELAKAIDRQRARLSGTADPDQILIVPARKPELAMPAAALAALSGTPIGFAERDRLPRATEEMLDRHPRSRIYALGGPSAIGPDAIEQLERDRGRGPDAAPGLVVQIGDSDPVLNAIELARFTDGSFGWGITDPGHGFVVANADRAADAAAAAPLSADGKPGPLLVTDTSRPPLPTALRRFLLSTKPGYRDDPTRAVYNHVWLIGGPEAISVGLQAQIDALVALQRVSTGPGPRFGPEPGEPEAEAPPADD